MRFLVAGALLLAAPAAAPAAVVTVDTSEFPDEGPDEDFSRKDVFDYAELKVTALRGERNRVTLRRGRAGYDIRDQGGSPLIVRTPACRRRSRTRVTCPLQIGFDVVTVSLGDRADSATVLPAGWPRALFVDAGAGDDRILTRTPSTARGGAGDDRLTATNPTSTLSGGPGADRLTGRGGGQLLLGGPGGDVLRGGTGNDVLDPGDAARIERDSVDGGPGRDELRHAQRRAAVRVTLGRRPRGSEDRLRAVEHVTGGRGDDVLVGDDAANRLAGGRGDDRLDGRGGDDVLRSGPPGRRRSEVLEGGAGDDRMLPVDDGTDRIGLVDVRCGAGEDVLGLIGLSVLLGADCEAYSDETFILDGVPLGRLSPTAGGLSFTVACPSGCRARWVRLEAPRERRSDPFVVLAEALLPEAGPGGRSGADLPRTNVGRRVVVRVLSSFDEVAWQTELPTG